MATVTEVARRAGVSLATVSRVQNGVTTVAPEIRDRVNVAIKELGYQPNPLAQGLRKGRSNTVALLVGDLAQRHLFELTVNVQTALEGEGMDLLLFNQGHSASRLNHFLARAPNMGLRGVVIAISDAFPSVAAPLLDRIRESGTTVVSVGQNLTGMEVQSVVYAEREATRRSVQYLIDKGHRKIAYVGRIKGSAIGADRFEGYKAAMKSIRAFDANLVWDRTYRYAAGRDAVVQAIDNGLEFTAIQAGSDEIAAGAMAGLHDKNLRVPQDVAVIGFGDIELGSYLRPALTTVSSDPRLAAEYVRQLMTNGQETGLAGITTIDRSLVIRDSA
jgi:DNA-binding LacI/PurR family transcriptional regulator